ncbi:dihydroxyacetone kinase subunit DhaL [Quadrisphaera sp. DSM 44207]|uniref:dihydroxyacetone kinase subunit DhaL n=1 Tax=Quadrisphaera sp. DSM 44207 TaxID=1881057 RepID=UPI00088F75B1|nr:dihydroxyacetone kinase subunit DhaL [Quadrisphaera sp. DSM 44207]SDQ49851.1 dihydroxyacetone kinase DhaL subunit [Quadrisphaera sp. DSM 44207]
MSAGVEDLRAWLRELAALVHERAGELTDLDRAIGDADHGANLDRGLRAVVAALDGEAGSAATPAALLRAVGMTLVSSVGGASGPLYGTFFLRFGAAAGEAQELDAAVLAAAFRAGLEGVVARGKAQVGDKTMVDALAPAVEALEGAVASGQDAGAALATAVAAGEQGRESTVALQARKGRASYLGERSAGHADPGATSAVLLLRAAASALGGAQQPGTAPG